jgi:hypothetical protein
VKYIDYRNTIHLQLMCKINHFVTKKFNTYFINKYVILAITASYYRHHFIH